MITDISLLKDIAEIEFVNIVEKAVIKDINELRIYIRDGSYLDIWFSLSLKERYSYHWERGHIDNSIFRHDNAPHKKWRYVKSFPKHFHDGNEEKVIESNISVIPEMGLREFLNFILNKLK